MQIGLGMEVALVFFLKAEAMSKYMTETFLQKSVSFQAMVDVLAIFYVIHHKVILSSDT